MRGRRHISQPESWLLVLTVTGESFGGRGVTTGTAEQGFGEEVGFALQSGRRRASCRRPSNYSSPPPRPSSTYFRPTFSFCPLQLLASLQERLIPGELLLEASRLKRPPFPGAPPPAACPLPHPFAPCSQRSPSIPPHFLPPLLFSPAAVFGGRRNCLLEGAERRETEEKSLDMINEKKGVIFLLPQRDLTVSGLGDLLKSMKLSIEKRSFEVYAFAFA